MLLAEITDREVGKRSVVDEAGLKAYFEAHRSDFHWDEPRYRGIVLHCTTKRVAKQVRKFLKQIPEEEWMDAIRLTFNAGDTPKVQAEQGLFAPVIMHMWMIWCLKGRMRLRFVISLYCCTRS